MIKVYSTPSCVYCRKLKDYLKAKNKPFQELIVGKDISHEEFEEKTGSRGVPVIEVDGQFTIGFNPEFIDTLDKF